MIKTVEELQSEKELFSELLKHFRQKWIDEVYSRSDELTDIILSYREQVVRISKKLEEITK